MAVYSRLPLSAGGGIGSEVQQVHQTPGVATVLISLGGTGVRAYNRLHPDNPESETSTYKHIRFLGVDIDPTNTGRKAACQKRDKRTD